MQREPGPKRAKKVCSIEWCDRPVKGLGLCGGHHQRSRTGVDMNRPWPQPRRQCSASPTCQRSGRVGNRGMCGRHHEADQRRRRNTGDWAGFMPADEVNAHIERLRASGVSLLRIAAISGMSRAGVRQLRQRERVWRVNGEKILAIDPVGVGDTEDSGFVPALGSRRRLRALAAVGFTQTYLAERLGLTTTWLYNLLHERTSQVRVSTARRIDAVFRELQLAVPPPSAGSTVARQRARAQGWALPLAWDEDTIDDPNAQPSEAKRRATFAEEIADHRETGRTDDAIAEYMSISLEGLQARLRRHGIPSGHRYRDMADQQLIYRDNPMSKKALAKLSA